MFWLIWVIIVGLIAGCAFGNLIWPHRGRLIWPHLRHEYPSSLR